jgi:hypothetical protein
MGFRIFQQRLQIGEGAGSSRFDTAQARILRRLASKRGFEFADDFLETFDKGGRAEDS